MNISRFLKDQRRKTDDYNSRENEKRKEYSHRPRDEDFEEPSNTIMIRGLPLDITEDDIKASLNELRADYIAVRLIKDRRTNYNKGVAFIEFIAVSDAKELMQYTRGELNISGFYGKLSYGHNVKEEINRYDAEKINAWKYDKPTSTIMLRGVSNILSDSEVRSYVADVSRHVVDVRLIRDKKTGIARGFGFVEFDSVSEAQRWMEYQQGVFVMEDVEMKLSYTSTRQSGLQLSEYFSTDPGDWTCARCGGHNFKRRDLCYKCHLSKMQSKSVMETIDGKDQIGTSPCRTLILRDLDALTVEDEIVKALKCQFSVTVTKCEIMRDEATKVSRCFAFAEMLSLNESTRIVEYYEDHPGKLFELAGKAISINYAKNSFNTLIISYKEALAKRFEEFPCEPPVQETSNYDANTAAAVTQAALNQKMNKKNTGMPGITVLPSKGAQAPPLSFELIVNGQRCTLVPTDPFNMADSATKTFMRPDTSQFLYDQSTQYYFDPITGLYYDSNSQYFFDRIAQQYLYWTQATNTFIAIDSPTKSDNNNSKTIEPSRTNDEKGDKKAKTKEAKKIAKEMERWEKMVNSKKDTPQNNSFRRDKTTAAIATISEDMQEEATADSGFAMFSDYGAEYYPLKMDYGRISDNLVASYVSDSDPDDLILVSCSMGSGGGSNSSSRRMMMATEPTIEEKEEKKLIDWEKMACHLCNRGFKDKATLERHISVSELHKKNMELLREKSEDGDSRTTRKKKNKYRDRARERREKFGVRSSGRKRTYDSAEEDVWVVGQGDNEGDGPGTEEVDQGGRGREGGVGDSVGSRLMAKMGWQKGQGLGKQNQGRTEIVEAEFVARGAGIGAAPKFQGPPSDNYRENLKRAMYAKYHDG